MAYLWTEMSYTQVRRKKMMKMVMVVLEMLPKITNKEMTGLKLVIKYNSSNSSRNTMMMVTAINLSRIKSMVMKMMRLRK